MLYVTFGWEFNDWGGEDIRIRILGFYKDPTLSNFLAPVQPQYIYKVRKQMFPILRRSPISECSAHSMGTTTTVHECWKGL